MKANLARQAARLVAGLTAATVALAALAARADDKTRPRADAPRAAKPAAAAHVELERLSRLQAKPQDGKPATPSPDVPNAFASTSWYVPPPPPKPEPPPKPVAPPLPFTFMGRYDDAAKGGPVVMLVKGDRLYTVTVGDVIDNTYRVDSISGSAVELTYLPLHEKQKLPTGGA